NLRIRTIRTSKFGIFNPPIQLSNAELRSAELRMSGFMVPMRVRKLEVEALHEPPPALNLNLNLNPNPTRRVEITIKIKITTPAFIAPMRVCHSQLSSNLEPSYSNYSNFEIRHF